MKTLALLEKAKEFWFLLSLSVLFFFLRLPSLFEPYWYGDEGIYEVIGMALRSGRLLYRDIWDNKTPLLYVLYSLFNGDQFWVRLLSIFFGISTVVAFFFLSKLLFSRSDKTKTHYFTTSLFALFFAIPLFEGNIANAENFMLFPIVAAGYLTVRMVSYRNNAHPSQKSSFFSIFQNPALQLFASGVLLSLAFLTKVVAIFDLGAFFVFLFFLSVRKNNISNNIFTFFLRLALFSIRAFTLIAGFVLPVMLSVLFFLFQNALSEFIHAVLASNVGYVGYGNKLLFISQGLLIIKLGLLGIFLYVLFRRRNTLAPTTLFIFIWLAFSLFNAYFSQRPYTHYLLVLLPSLSLLTGLIITEKGHRKLFTAVFVIISAALINSFTLYQKNFSYYLNFLHFLLGSKTTKEYQVFFDRKTPKDYELAAFINSHSIVGDTIIIWGNNAQLYKLTNRLPPGRYIVSYHFTASEQALAETEKAIQRVKPRYLIISSEKEDTLYPTLGYTPRIAIEDAVIYEKTR